MACSHHAVVDDGSSLSFGHARRGVLINPARLPAKGVGFYAPERWETRGLRYGTEELIEAVVWIGRELDRLHPGTAFAVADLSLPWGGPSAWHRSHQHGRDIDIPFLIRDGSGNHVATTAMHRFGGGGVAVGRDRKPITPSPGFTFDAERNWNVIKLLLNNPIAQVQYIFVSDDLKQLLIEHAVAKGESAEVVAAASYLLHQPSDSAPHSDHFHVRVYCPTNDLGYGCRDTGTLRWLKKSYKYKRPVEKAGLAELLVYLGERPIRLLSSIAGL